MTVKQLIQKLKTMPQDAIVATKAHDNGELEIQGHINDVFLVDYDEIRLEKPWLIEKNPIEDMGLHGKSVILMH